MYLSAIFFAKANWICWKIYNVQILDFPNLIACRHFDGSFNCLDSVPQEFGLFQSLLSLNLAGNNVRISLARSN